MFGGASNNPYDEIVVKTTDETLTSENWELILNLCDKVQDEGAPGAHGVVAALLKRLTHRNPNVQLYALSLAEALGKNCGIELHRELASRAWTAGLERVITDRNTHDKVRTRALGLVAMWTAEFADDSTLGIMGECYEGLKAKNYKYTRPDTPPPPAEDDAIRRREEEELQRVLEMSVRDRGGRGYASAFESASNVNTSTSSTSAFDSSSARAATSSTGAGGGGGSGVGGSNAAYGAGVAASGGYAGGYVPQQQGRERTPSPNPPPRTPTVDGAIVTRVRALHPFTPTEAGELGFEKGDVIKVVDRGYRDWWRGQLRGRTGIFPVNYVEPLPEPTPAELAAEATQEAAVFAQAVNVERLLNMLRALDPSKGDNLADDEEIQELYRSCMALRPKIVKLIDKYSQKRADLVSMNETFVRARTIFDRMMEDSLARHSGGTYYPQPQQAPYGAPVGPGTPGYGYPDAAAYQYAQQQGPQQGPPPQGQGQGQAAYGVYGAQGPTPYPAQGQPQPQAQGQTQSPSHGAQGPTPYPGQQQQPQTQGPIAQAQTQPQGPPYPAQQQQPQPQPQPQPAAQPVQQQQQQPAQQQPQPQPAVQQAQPQPEPQPQQQQQQQPAQQAGPPYVYDPHTTYTDPNVQAWAQYYAAGGKDLAGSVYFVSIPGITDPAPTPAPAPAAQAQPAQAQPQAQQPQPQVAQQQQQPQPLESAMSPTSPIDDDPGYFPDPYANQPEYATPVQTQPPTQDYYAQTVAAAAQTQHPNPHAAQSPGSELAHALGPQPTQAQYGAYALQDPGAGSASAAPMQRGYTLTDPGSGSAGAAAPSSPVAAYGASAAGGGGSPEPQTQAQAQGSTPSWVLPKKTATPGVGGRGAGSPQPAALAGQFAGMHV